jgi:hypothetical protein
MHPHSERRHITPRENTEEYSYTTRRTGTKCLEKQKQNLASLETEAQAVFEANHVHSTHLKPTLPTMAPPSHVSPLRNGRTRCCVRNLEHEDNSYFVSDHGDNVRLVRPGGGGFDGIKKKRNEEHWQKPLVAANIHTHVGLSATNLSPPFECTTKLGQTVETRSAKTYVPQNSHVPLNPGNLFTSQ